MIEIKGYPIEKGYMGWVVNEYKLFASEQDYREYMESEDEGDGTDVNNL